MPRRKALPIGNAGKIESRENNVHQKHVVDELSEEFFVREEEEYLCRRKRRRKDLASERPAALEVCFSAEYDWCFAYAHIEGGNVLKVLESISIELREDHLLLNGTGILRAPCEHAAVDLFALLQSGHITLTRPKDDTIGLCLGGPIMFFKLKSDTATWPEDDRQKSWQLKLLTVLKWLCPIAFREDSSVNLPISPSHSVGSLDVARIYSAVKPTGDEPELEVAPEHLVPVLRRYQKRAVRWMIAREMGSPGVLPKSSETHPLWVYVPLLGGTEHKCFYINSWTGRVSLQPFPAPSPVKGGILAEEMGLGKTVELLACIMSNRFRGPPPMVEGDTAGDPQCERIDCVCGAVAEDDYVGLWLQCEMCKAWLHGSCVGCPQKPPSGDYVCDRCVRKSASTPVTQDCGATLIVCPAPILQQWHDEILKHTTPGTLQILVYSGQGQPGSSVPVTTPAALARADIVLTTLEVLRSELFKDMDTTANDRSRRRAQRFPIVPTPLTRLRWWRLCCDESQLIEGGAAKAAIMVRKLEAVHRWAISGTPVSQGVEDLYGLFAFLRAAPFDNKFWWQRCIQRPIEEDHSREAWNNLLALLRPSQGGLLWRNSKSDVAEELGLPPQHHHQTYLHLSGIENHFYSRQHADCIAKARQALSPALLLAAIEADEKYEKFEDRPLTRREEKALLNPLLRLRQACCHPQVGSGGIRALAPTRAPMTMSEILDLLLTKAKVEAEDAQRALLASLNGLAGLLLLQDLRVEAVATYREALQVIGAHRDLVRSDKLQQLHTLHNLAEVLSTCVDVVPGLPRTLHDDTLKSEAAVLRQEYLAEAIAKLSAAQNDFDKLIKARDDIMAQFTGETHISDSTRLVDGWWFDAIAMLTQQTPDGGASACSAVQNALNNSGDNYRQAVTRNASNITGKFNDLSGLQILLNTHLQELHRAERKAMDELSTLSKACENPSDQLVTAAASCSRCRNEFAQVRGQVCAHCRLDQAFISWEVRLFELRTQALQQGVVVSAEEAASAAHAASLRHVGRGGFGEDVGPEMGTTNDVGSRRDEAVSRTSIVRQPSQGEQALRHVMHQLRTLKVHPDTPLGARKELLLSAAKVQLDTLELRRKAYIKARALSLAQRGKLLAIDELSMCTMRLSLLKECDHRREGEELFKLFPAEVPIRSTDLSNDKAMAQVDLNQRVHTVKYLEHLRTTELSLPSKKPHAQSDEEEEDNRVCPICHEPLSTQIVMMPCGHRLCFKCSNAIIDRLPGRIAKKAHMRIQCPMCRKMTLVDEIAVVDLALHPVSEGNEQGQKVDWDEDTALCVRGSFGTKVSFNWLFSYKCLTNVCTSSLF